MKRKPSTNTLIRKMDKAVAEAYKTHKEAIATRKEGTAIAEQLPGFITSIDWYSLRKLNEKKWYLETWCLDAKIGDDLIRQLKIWGAVGMKSKYHPLTNAWEFKCSAMVEDIELTIKIDGGSKPPNCRIEESKEMKEVITYKAICEETGDEV